MDLVMDRVMSATEREFNPNERMPSESEKSK